MATISDGTTTITLNLLTENDPDTELEQGIVAVASGSLKSQVSGERLTITEIFLMSGAQLSSVMQLLTNRAQAYFYKPDYVIPEYTSRIDEEFEAIFEYQGKTERLLYNGSRSYFVKFKISAVDLLLS